MYPFFFIIFFLFCLISACTYVFNSPLCHSPGDFIYLRIPNRIRRKKNWIKFSEILIHYSLSLSIVPVWHVNILRSQMVLHLPFFVFKVTSVGNMHIFIRSHAWNNSMYNELEIYMYVRIYVLLVSDKW